MPKYTANAYLVHKGAIVQTGGMVELTEEQAKRLGDKVEPTEYEGNHEYSEASLKKLSADEQKEIAEKLGGNLEELTNEEKRIKYILEQQ